MRVSVGTWQVNKEKNKRKEKEKNLLRLMHLYEKKQIAKLEKNESFLN